MNGVQIRSLKAGESLEQAIERVRRTEGAELIEVDVPVHHYAEVVPNDQQFAQQWSLKDGDRGAHFQEAWSITTGSEDRVIAVLDTGYTEHPDLNGKILPGYDMISDARIANDGNGRDADASDPGDWVAEGDPCYNGWPTRSTWHGTHVSGIIAANSNNAQGIVGGDWKAKILPVRVLGKCGGYISDIADGVRWAAGGQVNGVPQNPHPAQVINLSLGGAGNCGTYMQAAIDFALSQGSVVVVAAGNEGRNLDFSQITPANCQGVITVGASSRSRDRAAYSNFGERIDLMAPGGDYGEAILSTFNFGEQSPFTPSYLALTGTSMAAPHVAAAASLVLTVNRNFPALQVRDILKRATKPFFDFACDDLTCGTGLLDVAEALRLAQGTSPDQNFGVQAPITRGDANQDNHQVTHQKSGGCGTIDLGDGGGSGGQGPFLLTLLGLVMMAFEARKRRAATKV